MNRESEGQARTVQVEIFGAAYAVRGDQKGAYLQQLASTVDRTMREVAQHLPAVDTTRLAVLAALNLADELFQLKQQQEGERVAIEEKVTELAGELAAALRT